MRIEDIQIDGFGHFRNREIGPLGDVTVILDPDAAGASGGPCTLHAFIRAILFGFPESESPEWVPALAGGRHGGRLLVRDRHGAQLVIERHSDTRRAVTRALPDGGEYEGTLDGLLGNLTPDLYQAIFVFGVDAQQSVDAVLSCLIDRHTDATGTLDARLPEARDSQDQLRERRERIEAATRELERKLEALDGIARRISTLELARDDAARHLAQAHAEAGRVSEAHDAASTGPDAPHADADPAGRELRRRIDELRETWTRLQATRRMMEVYHQTVIRQSLPRGPVFLAVLITGTLLPLAIGALIGQAVIIAIGIASAILGAITLTLAIIARSRFDTAQAQARFQLEMTHRDAEARFFHAALAAGIGSDEVPAGIEELEARIAGLGGGHSSRSVLHEREDPPALLRAQRERAERDLARACREWSTEAARLGIDVDAATTPEQARAALGRERDELLIERGRLEERRAQLEREAWSSAAAGRLEAVLHAAGDAFDAMTLGAYHRLALAGGRHGNGENVVAISRDGQRVLLSGLSPGVREQAYLALRIGLVRACGPRLGHLPVLVDGALAQLDPARAVEALRAFCGLAERHQVLIFTGEPATAALVRSVSPGARVIALDEQRVPGRDPVRTDNG